MKTLSIERTASSDLQCQYPNRKPLSEHRNFSSTAGFRRLVSERRSAVRCNCRARLANAPFGNLPAQSVWPCYAQTIYLTDRSEKPAGNGAAFTVLVTDIVETFDSDNPLLCKMLVRPLRLPGPNFLLRRPLRPIGTQRKHRNRLAVYVAVLGSSRKQPTDNRLGPAKPRLQTGTLNSKHRLSPNHESRLDTGSSGFTPCPPSHAQKIKYFTP